MLHADTSRASALTTIALKLVEAGALEQGLSIIERISTQTEIAEALADIAHAVSGQGDHEKADVLFARAVSIAQNLSFDWFRVSTLTHIARTMADSGQHEQALVVARAIHVDPFWVQFLAFPINMLLSNVFSGMIEKGLLEPVASLVQDPSLFQEDKFQQRVQVLLILFQAFAPAG
jgi:hypothetical protein